MPSFGGPLRLQLRFLKGRVRFRRQVTPGTPNLRQTYWGCLCQPAAVQKASRKRSSAQSQTVRRVPPSYGYFVGTTIVDLINNPKSTAPHIAEFQSAAILP
jgi:hypothetical protein